MTLQNQEAQSLYLQALTAHNSGDIDHAEKLYRQILRSFPQLDPVLSNLGAILVGRKKLKEAIKVLEKAIKVNPNSPEALMNLAAAHKGLGKKKKAIHLYEQAIQKAPERPEAHFNLGNMQFEGGSPNEAAASFSEAIRLAPGFSSAHFNLGNVHYALGRPAEAAVSYRKTLDLMPDFGGALVNLGHVLADLGKGEEALGCYDRLIELEPKDARGHRYKGKALLDLGHLEAAETQLKQALTVVPEDLEAKVLLGTVYMTQNEREAAIAEFEAVLDIDPDNEYAERNYRRLLSRTLPAWHFTMLADEHRNQAYQDALNKAVKRDMLVLDIGAGSGLLSMMAAKAGAKEVIGCEMLPQLAKVATDIVAKNKYQHQVKILSKKSTDLIVGEDLPGKANLLVSEILDGGLLGEGVLPTLRHAKEHLLTPEATLIPARAAVWGILIEIPERRKVNPIKKVSGFDLSLFDRFRSSDEPKGVFLDYEPYQALSVPFPISDIDFYHLPPPAPEEKPIIIDLEPEAFKAGIAHGVAFWFDLYLDDEIMVSSRPGGELKHWGQACYFFDRDVRVKPGRKLPIQILQSDKMFQAFLR